jgi:hypothetical protein
MDTHNIQNLLEYRITSLSPNFELCITEYDTKV